MASDGYFAPLIAEGALLRLRAGARCLERYRRELQVQPVQQLKAAGLSLAQLRG